MRKSTAGVTLMELLVAISLLSLLSAAVLMAMRLGFNAMQTANDKLMANRRVVRAQRIIEEQIAGFMPLVALCQSDLEAPPGKMPFFQGEPQSMRFLSTYSLGEASRGYPRILEFQVIPGQENRGVRLVVNEHLYTGPRGAGVFCIGVGPDPALGANAPLFRPIVVGPGSFVLADRLAFCRFSFRQTMPPPVLEQWVPRWLLTQWPTAVRIEMAPLEADPASIQPVTLTAPLRVTRIPMTDYVD